MEAKQENSTAPKEQQQQKKTKVGGLTALLIGCTGLTGSYALNYLLQDPRYTRVIAPSRRPLDLEVTTVKDSEAANRVDFSKLENPVGSDILAALPLQTIDHIDHAFICIGTTKAKTPNSKEYHAIDVEIPVNAATLARDKGASYVGVVSSMGANKSSSFQYMRFKGEMEEGILAVDVPNVTVLQPSTIIGKRNERRIGESIGRGLGHVLGWMYPKDYRNIHAGDIARRLIDNAFADAGKVRIKSGSIKQ